MSILVILVGNVGTGKSTFCNQLKKKDRVVVCTDNYVGDKKEKQKKLFNEIENGLENNKYVIIDSPSLTRRQRDRLLYFKKNKHIAIAIDFGIGNKTSLERRIKSKPELSASEWTVIHIKNQVDYEKPEINEGFVRIINMKQNY